MQPRVDFGVLPVPARGLYISIVAFMTVMALSGVAPDCRAEETIDLERIRSAIHELRTNLDNDSTELTSVREQAFGLERDIFTAEKEQIGLERQISDKTIRVDALLKQKNEIYDLLETSRGYLRKSARSRYAQSLQPKLKILLNQDDAGRLSRNLAYYDYVIARQNRNVGRIRSHLENLEQTEAALKLEVNTLRILEHETTTRLELLKKIRSERSELAAVIKARMDLGNSRMEHLQEDERRLAELIGKLGRRQVARQDHTPFIALKGKLDWPARGPVANAPGMALRQGGARWSGVLIQAESGTEVKAVAQGRVVFADWFRNLGQLVIIDHGDGYMTLYGNNARLHKSAGDSVDASEIIATVGGGGEFPDGLYFELRAGGEPLDPRHWFIASQ